MLEILNYLKPIHACRFFTGLQSQSKRLYKWTKLRNRVRWLQFQYVPSISKHFQGPFSEVSTRCLTPSTAKCISLKAPGRLSRVMSFLPVDQIVSLTTWNFNVCCCNCVFFPVWFGSNSAMFVNQITHVSWSDHPCLLGCWNPLLCTWLMKSPCWLLDSPFCRLDQL